MANFIYTCSDGDLLDEICWKYYGAGYNVSPLYYVRDANPGLADIEPVLPAGLKIVLPDLPAGTKITTVTTPWSS